MGLSRPATSLTVIGSSIFVGVCVYSFYRYWKKREFKSIDEGFEDVSKIEDSPVKRILVLGLKGAGKSTILSQITSNNLERSKTITPTEGFNITTLEHNGITLNIWEIGGCEKVRPYWKNFVDSTDVLVFVVDSADLHNLSLAVREVQWLMADDQLHRVPVLLLAHKQDLPGALTPNQVADALDIRSVSASRHVVTILGSESPMTTDGCKHASIVEVQKTLLRIVGG